VGIQAQFCRLTPLIWANGGGIVDDFDDLTLLFKQGDQAPRALLRG
jgi:hypothetical protein